jgi:predicted ATP-dependent endonuclease of OLD family
MFKIKNCKFIGLPGIQDLEIDFSTITTLTGPNGTGKSTVLKILDLAFRILEEREVCNNLPQHDPWHLFASASLEFESDASLETSLLGDIKTLTIFIECDNSSYYISHISTHQKCLSITKPALSVDIEKWKLLVAQAQTQMAEYEKNLRSIPANSQPYIQLQQQQKNGRHIVTKNEKENSDLIDNNNNINLKFSEEENETDLTIHRSKFIEFLKELNTPTIKHITTQQLMEQDITPLIDNLITLKKGNKSDSKSFKIKEERINELLQSEIDVSETKEGEKKLLIHGHPYEKSSAGTYLTLSFFALTESEDANKIVLWDEPENGLHPTRRIQLLDLMHRDGRQFIVATHATEFAPVLQANSKVYRCVSDYDEDTSRLRFSVVSVATRRDAFETLEALGIHPARTLFTANVVIWVEGPTELLFYRHWLNLRLENDGYQEGLHYSFMQYGGSLINYLEVADTGAFTSTIDLLSHCRHPIVLVDSDIQEKPLLEQKNILKPGAQRILNEIEKLNKERTNAAIFQATQGREIENYLPRDSIWHAIEKLWVDFSKIKNDLPLNELELGQYCKYPEAIEKFFANENIVDVHGLPKGRSLWGSGNKVAMMAAALTMPDFEEHKLQFNCSMGLSEIEKFIRSKHSVEYPIGLIKKHSD